MKKNMSPRPSVDDWRRQGQARYLQGVKLEYKDYMPLRIDWDHDHCEFCGDKFSTSKGDLNRGYCSPDGKHWVCEPCYNDFHEEFDF